MAQDRRFVIKKDDTRPPLQVQITTPLGAPRDLSDYAGAGALKFYMGQHGVEPAKVDANATAVLLSQGIIQYVFTSADTNTVGEYRAEFALILGTAVETFPHDGYIIVEVIEDIV